MKVFSRCGSVYAISKQFELVDVKMGKYCRKLHRCSSVPSEMSKEMYDPNTTVWTTHNLDAYNLEVTILVKESYVDKTLDKSSSRVVTTDVNGTHKSVPRDIVLKSVVGSPLSSDMPTRRISANRRQARADIFDDIKEEDIAHLLENKTHSDIESDLSMRGRRCALGNIFHGLRMEELDKLFKCDFIGHNSLRRRYGLGDIFNGITEDEINRLKECEEIEECSVGCPTHCRTGRRFALGDIFNDTDSIEGYARLHQFGNGEDDEASTLDLDLEKPSNLYTRRFALADIFSDVSEDDLHRILYELDPVDDDHDEVPYIDNDTCL